MKPALATFFSGIFVAGMAAQSLGMFGGGVPSIASPASFVLVLPAFLGIPGWLIVLFALSVFWLWSNSLFFGRTEIPDRTIVLFVLVSLLSIANFWFGWTYGVEFQGQNYAYWCLALNLFFLLACATTLWRAYLFPAFYTSLLTHALLFSWIYSYAFTYLGETP
jgi:hypothetical protein